MHLVSRVTNLVRGVLAQWIGRREHRNPAAVYEAAINERVAQYDALRAAAAGVIYLRGKLARELEMTSQQLAGLEGRLEMAVDRDDDATALGLIRRRDGLRGEVDRLAGELSELTNEAEAAKSNLIAFQDDIARLRDEKVRMLARLANAKARTRLQHTLNGFSTEADLRALEAVREHIERQVTEVQLGRDLANTDLEHRLGAIRDAEASAAARAQLDELKRSRKSRLLPVLLDSAPRGSSSVSVSANGGG
jgi:phage shock protein A